jgi:flagellar biosynthesis/type III secretory pathway protein FliH
MLHEKSIRFPARLVGVHRMDAAAGNATPSASETALQKDAIAAADLAKEREALRQLLERLAGVAGQLKQQQQQHLLEMQRTAVELAVAMASQFLRTRLETADFPIAALVREAVERLQPRRPVTVQLHPDDLVLLEQQLGGDPALQGSGVRFVADPSLGRGGCHAQAGDVKIVADFPAQLSEWRDRLLRTLSEAAQNDPVVRSISEHRKTA